jgi:hypothetical protein
MAPAARMAKLERLYRAAYQRDLSGSEREHLLASSRARLELQARM